MTGEIAPGASGAERSRLSVQQLRICREGTDVDVVDDVTFTVEAGEVMGLVGESGSGKTTVALALLGYARRGLRIASGRVVLDGVDALALPARELRGWRGGKVAYVAQDPSSALNPALRVRTQLAEAYAAHAGGAERTLDARLDEVFQAVNLQPAGDYLRRYPHQLSGGQQQRVALAMAFLCEPSLIVLDEPTTGLDVSTQRHVLGTVRTLCQSHGVTAVIVSHDLAVVSDLASTIAVMYAGRVVESGSTKRVFRDPVHPYTRGLLDALPSPHRTARLRGIEGQPPQPGHRPPGCSFAPRCALRVAVCTAEMPALEPLGDRLVRCWRAAETVTPRGAADPIARAALRSESVLSVTALRAKHADNEVLHGVGFAVPANACVAVVGESGSGKTTLAGCIVGLHRDYTGSVTFRDAELAPGAAQRARATLREVQYVFQNPYASLNPRKTVGQIIAQQLEHHFDLDARERRSRVLSMLDELALPRDFESRFPDELSGGERQRVAIARALVVDPVLLVCDEVTSALDVSVQAVIVELLRRLQADRGLSMLFITHNLALVRSIAQEVVVIADGIVVESGTVEDVLERPQHAYTVRLIEDIPKLDLATA